MAFPPLESKVDESHRKRHFRAKHLRAKRENQKLKMPFPPLESKVDESYRKRHFRVKHLRAKRENQKLKMGLRKESSHFVSDCKRRKMEEQRKQFSDHYMQQLPREREKEMEAFRKNWRCLRKSEKLKKLPIEGPREKQGKTSPMILIDLNEEPIQPLFGEGSSIAELHKDPPQPLFGEGSSMAALCAGMDLRDLDVRDLKKRNPQAQQQHHEPETLLFGPGSRLVAIRSGMNCNESKILKTAAVDEKVVREIGLNLHRREERPGVSPEEKEATKARDEGVNWGLCKENLDVLCNLAMDEIQRIGKAERLGEKVEVTRHTEDGADFYGARQEKFSEMTETDGPRIYREDLNVLYKGSGTPPAKHNREALGLITLEDAAREDVEFVDKGFPTCPTRNWEDLNWELSNFLTRSTMQEVLARYNNKPSPIQVAATVSACNLPNLKKYLRLLRQLLELLVNHC